MSVDIRDDTKVAEAAKRCTEHFGGIDIVVNNASAISLTGTLETPMKRFDLMFGVNVRGTYCCSQACIPQSAHPQSRAPAQPEPEVVQASQRLHDGEIRHEHVCDRHGGGVKAAVRSGASARSSRPTRSRARGP
ncbi:MAG: SDR family oxidoreductase [Chromatiales bacterium]